MLFRSDVSQHSGGQAAFYDSLNQSHSPTEMDGKTTDLDNPMGYPEDAILETDNILYDEDNDGLSLGQIGRASCRERV